MNERDNGSNLNCAEVNDVLARHRVIPLNSPAHYPRYNGAIENSIQHFKSTCSLACTHPSTGTPNAITPIGRGLVIQLNAQPRRSLQPWACLFGPSQLSAPPTQTAHNPNVNVNENAVRRWDASLPTPAAVYHAHTRRWTQRFRQHTFQWIESRWIDTIRPMEKPNRRTLATAWRDAVVAWLRRQELIRFSQPTTTVLPLSPEII